MSQVIVEEHGMDSLDQIKLLTHNEIESLWMVLHGSWGTIPRPNPGDQLIQTRHPVKLHTANHLKLLPFKLCHQEQVSRQFSAGTLDTIHTLRKLKDFETKYKAPDISPTINAKDWQKTIQNAQRCLRFISEIRNPLCSPLCLKHFNDTSCLFKNRNLRKWLFL